MLGDDVGALADQHLGRVRLLAGVEPRAHPDDLQLEVGVDGLRAQQEGVDAADHLRDRERGDVARDPALRHPRRDLADDVASLVEARRIRGHVVGPLVARGVLELHVREVPGHLDGRLHVAERGGEDDSGPLADEAGDRAFGVGAFGHVLDVDGLDPVAERFLDREPPLIVLVGPAVVADRADVDESDHQLVGAGDGGDGERQRESGQCRECFPHRFSSSLGLGAGRFTDPARRAGRCKRGCSLSSGCGCRRSAPGRRS